MRLAFVAQDRPALAETVKCLSRDMAAPTEGSLSELRRVVRYCKAKPRAELRFYVQTRPSTTVEVYVDSDWAGDTLRRRSTTGMVAMIGGHCIRHASLVQTAVGLSSAEAEFYALCRGAASGLGLIQYLGDLGLDYSLRCWSDSSAARSVAARRGVG